MRAFSLFRLLPAGILMCSACLVFPIENAAAQIISGKPVLRSYENELTLLRTDLRADVREIMRTNFVLPQDQAEEFWPIYVKYEAESGAIWDEKHALIKEYVGKRERLSDDDAQDIMDDLFDLDDRTTKLRRRYFRIIKREVSATVALRFMQLDRRVNSLVEIQLAQDIPLAK